MTCYIVCYIMPVLKRLNQYLKCRDGFWSYNRRVPHAYKDLDTRGTIRAALATSSIEVARARRDALAAADEAFWKSVSGGDTSARNAYEAARSRAMSKGMIYIPADAGLPPSGGPPAALELGGQGRPSGSTGTQCRSGRMGEARSFRGRRLVARRAVRADGVVVLSPAFDEELCLLQAVEDFSVQEFISELPI